MDTYNSQTAYEQIIEKYKNVVYAIALTHTQNKYDADDVFQEVFLAFFKQKRSFADEEHKKAWLIRTTLNFSKKSYNASIWRRASQYSELDCISVFSDPREAELFSAIKDLPDKLRTPIHLFYFEDMKTKEIAKILKISDTNVRMRLSRGREKLKHILTGGHENE